VEGVCIEENLRVPASPLQPVDLLFVIDDGGVLEYRGEPARVQDLLVARFPAIEAALGGRDGRLPDLHLGVISSDLGVGAAYPGLCTIEGDGGVLQNAPRVEGCGPPDGRWIRTEPPNFASTLGDSFGCIARLGEQGCPFRQPFEAMRRALDRHPENVGFLRPDSILAVFFLATEDDCSVSTPELFDPEDTGLGAFSMFRCVDYGILCDGAPIGWEPRMVDEADGDPHCFGHGERDSANGDFLWHPDIYVEFLRGLRPDPGRLLVAASAGNPEPVMVYRDGQQNPSVAASCVTVPTGWGYPSIRLRDVVTAFGEDGDLASICRLPEDRFAFFERLGELADTRCLPDGFPLDVACAVFETTPVAEAVVPPCASAGAPPCWSIREAPVCSDGPPFALEIERDEPPAADAWISVRCPED
jgi:hypothetical protein